jgi:hypothetical protein
MGLHEALARENAKIGPSWNLCLEKSKTIMISEAYTLVPSAA